jgi:hypothetical protein
MSIRPHIIHKQVLNISLPISQQSHVVQANLGRWCKTELPALLNEICDSLSPGNELIKIDKIRIDVGNAGDGMEMTEIIKEKFQEVLLPLIQQEKKNIPESFPENNQITTDESKMEILRQFLQCGIFPVGDENKNRKFLAEITRSLFASVPSELRKIFREALQQEQTLERIVHFYNHEELEIIAANLSGLQAKMIRTQTNEIIDIAQKAVAADRVKLNNLVWKNLFQIIVTGNLISEKEMAKKIKEKLQEESLQLIQQEQKNLLESLAKKNHITKDESKMEILRQFLLHGIFPVGDENKNRKFLTEITCSLFASVPSELRKIFREALQQEQTLERIVHFYNREELEIIAANLSGLQAKMVRIQINETVDMVQKAIAVNVNQLNKLTWKNLFQIIVTENSNVSSELFLQFLCRSLASAASVTESELFHLLQEQIKEAQKCGKVFESSLPLFVEKMLNGNVDELNTLKKRLASQSEKTPPLSLQKEDSSSKKTVSPNEKWSDGARIGHAGIILLWPFLPDFFRKMELVEKENFVNEAAQHRAMYLLQYMATGNGNSNAPVFPLVKLLCGVSPTESIEVDFLNEEERNACDEMLKEVIAAWPALKSAGPSYLRSMFLQREGQLKKQDRSWNLIVQQETQDILLGKLSWGVSVVRMPWNKTLIYTEWL